MGQIRAGNRCRAKRAGIGTRAAATIMLAAFLLCWGAAAFGDTVFSDDFEAALAGWTLTGTVDWYTGNPKNGTHSVQLRQTEEIDRVVSTVGYSSITVSFALAAYSLDNSGEVVRASWYDGATWTILKEIRGGTAENDGVLRTYSYALPAGANDSQNLRLRFQIVANSHGNDYGYVDDVLVTGQLIQRTLTLTGSGSGSVKVNGTLQSLPWSGQFANGTQVTIEAVPASGWAFDTWSGDASGKANPVNMVLNANKSITANFTQLSYTLTLAKLGSGSIEVNGATVALPYSAQFLSGTNVTLEALAASGWEFASWSGDASGSSNPVVVTMNGAKSVTANFSQLSYTLSLAKVGNGSVKVDGSTVSLPYSAQFLSGTNVTLEAIAASGWEFGSWSGDAGGSTNPIVVTMDGAKSVTANFNQLSYTLSLAKVGSGSVKVNGSTVSLPYSAQFLSGTAVALEAVAQSGWAFGSWSGDAGGSTNPIIVTMDGAKSVTATFSQLSYTLSLAKVGDGSLKVNGVTVSLPYSAQFLSGTNVALEAVAASGWEFASWSGDASGTSNPVVVTMDGDRAVTATLSQLSYMLSIAGVGSGSAKVNGAVMSLPYSAQFLSGSAVTLEAVPASGWQFASWSGDVSGTANPVVVTMDAAKSVTANFNRVQYTLSLSKVGSGVVKVNGTTQSLPWSGSFYSGDEVTLEAMPADGWRFAGWSGDASWPTSPLVVTMSSNKSIAATFDQLNYTLSVSKVGEGSIIVDGTPHSLPWSGQIVYGSEVTVEAVAASGWRFTGWSGDMTWQGSLVVVTMTGDKNLTANFSDSGYTLTIAKVGSGSVKVNGTLHDLPWSGEFAVGSQVTLEAVAASGWEFAGWSGDASWPTSPLVVTMSSDKSITATFVERSTFELSLSKSGEGALKVNGLAVILPWSGEFERGAQVTLEAVADSGQQFESWSGDLSSTENPVVVTMDRDWSIAADFTHTQCQLDISVAGGGSVKLDGVAYTLPWSGSFDAGSQVTVEAVADAGWRFANWSGDVTGTENPISVEISQDTSLTATFLLPDEYMLTVEKLGLGTVKVDGAVHALPWTGIFSRGSEVVLKAVADGTQEFVEWSGDASGSDNPLTVLMDGDKTITANFMCVESPFADVPCDHWAAAAIIATWEAGIVQGYPDGLYRPGFAVDRAAMAVYLVRALVGGDDQIPTPAAQEPTFPDVPADHWAYAAVEYAAANGIVRGYGDGSYQPSWQVTRGQMAAFVARAIAEPIGEQGMEGYEAPADPTFADVPTSMWCYTHVEYLSELGIVSGYPDGLYRPTATVTRDQMAVYVARAFGLMD